MMRSLIVLALLLLAGPVDPRSGQTASEPQGVHMERHIDAHVPAREDERTTNQRDARSESSSAPLPAPGTGVIQSPPPAPLIESPFDPLYRRY